MIKQGILTLALLVLGILFAKGKGTFLIAGYNTMSPEEKAKVDTKKMLKNLSVLMFTCAACTALGLLGALTAHPWLLNLSYLLILPCVIYFVIRINKESKEEED